MTALRVSRRETLSLAVPHTSWTACASPSPRAEFRSSTRCAWPPFRSTILGDDTISVRLRPERSDIAEVDSSDLAVRRLATWHCGCVRGKRSKKRSWGEARPLQMDRLPSCRGTERGPDGGDYQVRRLPGSAKEYTCPACMRPIPVGRQHVVAWPGNTLLGLPQGSRDAASALGVLAAG